ncbi:hypothetical protein [Novosphingobium terrae]|uniref:hypothetical protein n=1 Tax=Novosphingobium terrae TaxID=2726189 RepID=UPI00197F638B|nr:hypothetical protein [Novosphingobium terrae]
MSTIVTEFDLATSSSSSTPSAAAKAKSQRADFAKVLAEFNKAATETQYERIRDGILKKHKMTEQEYSVLTGPEKDKINDEIQEAVKRAALQSRGMSATAASSVAANGLLA